MVESITVKVPEKNQAMPETTKVKRYLNHGIIPTTPPCPTPYYQHYDMPKLPTPYLPPVYGPPKPVYGPPKPVYGPPKPVYGPPVQSPLKQYIYQSSNDYISKPSLEWMKPQVTIPVYNQQQYKHETIQVQPMIKEQNTYWQIPQTQHAYAPNYHVPMYLPTQKDWIKPLNYHSAQANNFNNPGIIYKDDHPKDCKPCTNNQISYQSIHQRISSPQIIHVQPTYAKPIIHQAPIRPNLHYLPTAPIVKHHEHIEPCDK